MLSTAITASTFIIVTVIVLFVRRTSTSDSNLCLALALLVRYLKSSILAVRQRSGAFRHRHRHLFNLPSRLSFSILFVVSIPSAGAGVIFDSMHVTPISEAISEVVCESRKGCVFLLLFKNIFTSSLGWPHSQNCIRGRMADSARHWTRELLSITSKISRRVKVEPIGHPSGATWYKSLTNIKYIYNRLINSKS